MERGVDALGYPKYWPTSASNVPVFRCKGLNGEYVSKLNPFATIWRVIENISTCWVNDNDLSFLL